MSRRNYWVRGAALCCGLAILIGVYVFQRLSLGAVFEGLHPNVVFSVNRTIRLILNDIACVLIIFALFSEKKYVKIAFLVFLVELLVVLPAYLLIKLSLEGDSEISSPLLSQIHRLIVNPMLMILLIVAFFYQRHVRG